MNKFQTLVSKSQFAFWIQATAPDSFALVDLAPDSLEVVAIRGDFVGLVGFSGIVPRVALAMEIDDTSTSALSQAVIALIGQAMVRLETGRHQCHAWSEST